MKKQAICITLSAIIFCCMFGCTKQKNFDLIEFCERYNKTYSKETISYENFFIEPSNGQTQNSCFLTTSEGRKVLLNISSDNNGTITGITITGTKECAENSQIYLTDLYDLYIKSIAILTLTDFDTALASTIDCGIIKDNIGFNDYSYKTEVKTFSYRVFENSEIISLYCDNKTELKN